MNDEEARKLASELPLLKNLGKFLESRGFTIKLHSSLKGVSGIESGFDLIAEKGSIQVVMDVSLEGQKNDIVAFLAKKIDINPSKALILDLSGGNELANLGKVYGIDVQTVDAKGSQEVPVEFESLISNLLNGSKDKGPASSKLEK